MKTLFFDCFAGASGDMIVGALLDAGASPDAVVTAIEGLDLEGVSIGTEDVTRASIRAHKFNVSAEVTKEPRHLADIEKLLGDATLLPEVRTLAIQTFRVLADAEAHVHGVTPNEVHFHEVGAVDAIVDIVAACAAFTDLEPQQTICSPVTIGRGPIDTEHGQMSSPAPAVIELLRGVEIVERWDHESVTPTGAALLRTFSDRFGRLPEMRLEATGYGAGTRDTVHPNVLRVLIGEAGELEHSSETYLVEANIDDMSPELFPYVIEALMGAGAHDAWTTPIAMKKGRHAITLSVLAGESDVDRLSDIIFRETTTFGVRKQEVLKEALPRLWVEVEVFGMSMRVKVAHRAGEVVSIAPEYEEATRVARGTGRPLKDVYAAATSVAQQALDNAPIG
jgi:uncharacterized protein (TIGR00299 family) protein